MAWAIRSICRVPWSCFCRDNADARCSCGTDGTNRTYRTYKTYKTYKTNRRPIWAVICGEDRAAGGNPRIVGQGVHMP